MRLQQPRFEQKSEPDRAQVPCTASSLSDIADKVNHLLAISDTRWWSLAGQTVKQGISRYVKKELSELRARVTRLEGSLSAEKACVAKLEILLLAGHQPRKLSAEKLLRPSRS
ncbi:hypothetical protein TIFTF001_047157 [Ficus carica]|uniref:Uncharacterized protein n=1 Tax=Ficus carica TaxID=3494 RepID=A0AA88CK55_FICCA|nr:hypothetical protein TIFTF001_047157 [Ficus carica]